MSAHAKCSKIPEQNNALGKSGPVIVRLLRGYGRWTPSCTDDAIHGATQNFRMQS